MTHLTFQNLDLEKTVNSTSYFKCSSKCSSPTNDGRKGGCQVTYFRVSSLPMEEFGGMNLSTKTSDFSAGDPGLFPVYSQKSTLTTFIVVTLTTKVL